jgi:hypothetical protein
MLRVRMRFRQREMPVDEAELLTHVAPDSLYHGMSAPAVRALEIAVLYQRYRRIGRAE